LENLGFGLYFLSLNAWMCYKMMTDQVGEPRI
jgi:hypothetical protein